MSADALAAAYVALDLDWVRTSVGDGDFSVLEGIDLTADEMDLLRAVANEDPHPEDAGFEPASSPTVRVLRSFEGNLTSAPTQWLVQQSVVSRFGGHSSIRFD